MIIPYKNFLLGLGSLHMGTVMNWDCFLLEAKVVCLIMSISVFLRWCSLNTQSINIFCQRSKVGFLFVRWISERSVTFLCWQWMTIIFLIVCWRRWPGIDSLFLDWCVLYIRGHCHRGTIFKSIILVVLCIWIDDIILKESFLFSFSYNMRDGALTFSQFTTIKSLSQSIWVLLVIIGLNFHSRWPTNTFRKSKIMQLVWSFPLVL